MNQRVFYTKLAPYYDYLVSPTAEQECQFLNDIFQKFGKGKIKKVLDLGCGTGRHSCILSKMGYRMTGIDLSEEMLAVARSKCPNVDFKKMSFNKLEFPENFFDAAICMWTTIGYLLSKRDFKTFVKKVYYVTKYLLVLDSSNYENPDKTKPVEKGEGLVTLPGLIIKSSYTRNFDKKTKIREEKYNYELIKKGRNLCFEDENCLRMWTLAETTNLLFPEFRLLEVYGGYSLDQKFVADKSDRKLIIAEKI